MINSMLKMNLKYGSTAFLFLCFIAALWSARVQGQSLIPVNEGGFEAGTTLATNNWTVVNDVRNKWFVGTVSKCNGSRGAYIDSTATGTSNVYNVNVASVSHFYRDIAFPACPSGITLTFNYKGKGQNISNQNTTPLDFLAVYIVPTGSTPVAGTQLPAANKVGAAGYNLTNNNCSAVTITLPASLAGSTQRLVFSWINDISGGTNPAITVDDISVTASTAAVANDNPCGATPVTVGSTCNYVTYNNTGATPSTGYPNPSCGSYAGGDVWFTTTIPASGQLVIDGNIGGITDGAMAVYIGPNPNNLTEVACDDDNSANGFMPYLNLTTLLPGTQIWIRFWDFGGNDFGTFQLCFYSGVCPGGVPPNDLCTNAIPIALGSTITGTTACASGVNEPVGASCWLNGSLNTVWYSVVCPPSGKISLRTGLGTLTNTQIALYSGNCSALTLLSCNNDVTSCGSTQFWSEIVATGLTPGATYFVRVDGYQSLNGDFTLTAIDGNSTWPTVFGQDCSSTFSVCSPNFSVGNPGFIGSGNNCDFSAGSGCPSCLLSGERNAVWYSFSAATAGTIQFTLTPNNGVDYDFAMWDVTGLTNPCATISGGTLPPIRCSYAAPFLASNTGLSTTVNDQCEAANGDGFVSAINATAGQTFLLVISNFSTTYVGYSLNFFGSPLNYTAGSQLSWTGGTDTDWSKSGNWGGCASPDCAKDVVIYGGPANQPYIAPGQTFNCKNITIQPGASLTLGPNSVLEVCGNFTNSGVLNADPTSIIRFANGSVVQSINGMVINPNELGSVEVSKTGGNLSLNTNTEMSGDFSILNATSAVNANGFTHRLSGNFLNNGIYNAGSSTLIFNGTSGQSYYNAYGGSQLLNNVTMSHGGPGVSLASFMRLGGGGVLTLTSGKIITGAGNEVVVLNRAPSSVTTGNTGSYVEGNLRRHLNPTGSYDFPVGEAAKGYQRSNINFTDPANANQLDNILVNFSAYSSPPPGPGTIDCGISYNLNSLDNGFWNFVPSSAASTGLFNLSLYNTNYTNPASAWTIKSVPAGGGSWAVANGSCAASTVNLVSRTGMSGLSSFGTTQSGSLLPVSWLSFEAVPYSNYVRLKWSTASEDNNMGYQVQRLAGSETEFQPIGWVDGAGTTREVTAYVYDDVNAPSGQLIYYRLKQVDFNGAHDYSDVVATRMDGSVKPEIRVYPQPIVDDAMLYIRLDFESEARITIVDACGGIVCRQGIGLLPEGVSSFPLNGICRKLIPGMYTIRVEAGEQSLNSKLMVAGSGY